MKQTIRIIGGELLQVPLVEEAHKMGFDTVVTDRDSNCPCRGIATVFAQIDTFDSAQHVKSAILWLNGDIGQIVGCICAGSDAIETAENVNGWIRTQTNNKHGFWDGSKATAICRNKVMFREWQKQHKFNLTRKIKVRKDEKLLQCDTVYIVHAVEN